MDPKFRFLWLLLALICFVVATFWAITPGNVEGGPWYRRPNLIAAGLFFFILGPTYIAWKAL